MRAPAPSARVALVARVGRAAFAQRRSQLRDPILPAHHTRAPLPLPPPSPSPRARRALRGIDGRIVNYVGVQCTVSDAVARIMTAQQAAKRAGMAGGAGAALGAGPAGGAGGAGAAGGADVGADASAVV